MTLRLQLLSRSEVGRDAWDNLAAASDDAWLWHLSDLIDATSTWPGTRDISFAIVNEAGAPLAIVPLQVIGDGFGRLGRRLLSLGGIALHPDIEDEQKQAALERIAEELDGLLRAEEAGEVELRISPLAPKLWRAPPVASVVFAGFECRPAKSWVVDLTPPLDAIRRNYSKGGRSEIRKAERSEVRVREASGHRDLETYYGLHLETYRRTGARTHPFVYFERIFEIFVPHGRARVLFAEHKGRVVAAQNTALFKDGAWYWTGASVTEKSGGENRFLAHQQIAAAKDSGAVRYDMGEAFGEKSGAKDAGLSLFKSSFGGTLSAFPVSIRRNTTHRFRLVRALRTCVRTVRGRWGMAIR